jgi:transcriptional regulator with PAS, ATPase and Fis domain
MRGVFGQIVKVAKTDSTVLITGESGTGKELIAQAVYEHSSRADKPFVKLNCAAIPENLLESELFGHEKGAFTGAQTRKVGKFELANHGTIFLDEIGDMPLPLQSKILRVLQEKEIEPVGGGHPKKIDVRFVAATNKNIEKMVAEGDFREDLFFRLNVFAIILPPLRYRREDIPHLVRHFLDKHSGKHGCSPSAMDVLMRQEWPGNIRELQNVVERAILEAGDIKDIKPDHLPLDAAPSLGNADAPALDQVVPDEESSLDDYLAETEKNIIMNALHEAQGIQAKAARRLGIKERSLWHRVKKYEINAADYKPDKK